MSSTGQGRSGKGGLSTCGVGKVNVRPCGVAGGQGPGVGKDTGVLAIGGAGTVQGDIGPYVNGLCIPRLGSGVGGIHDEGDAVVGE